MPILPSPSIALQFAPTSRFFLDVCSGASAPVSAAIAARCGNRFQPVDLIFGPQFDLLNDDAFFHLTKVAASGIIGAALAAPYCRDHSSAKLIQPGPQPIRTPDHLDGLPHNTSDQHWDVQLSATMHDRCRLLLSLVEASGALVILENPVSSMTFLDDLMVRWLQTVAPFGAQAFACRFGADWKKRWLFMSNHPSIHALGLDCNHPSGSHTNVAGVRLPDGTWLTQKTAEYPQLLADALADIIMPWITPGGMVLSLQSWQTALPAKLVWPDRAVRIEDGGGTSSTALHVFPQAHDPLGLLRTAWLKRLCDGHWPLKIMAALASGKPGSPLTSDELKPFTQDLLQYLHLDEASLTISPEQPFRLGIWKALASLWDDPELPLFSLLDEGVPLGVDEPLTPSPAWPSISQSIGDPPPLEHCTQSYSSALDHFELVTNLLEEEMAAGFIAEVKGGVSELQSRYPKSAIGKLAVIVIEGKAPRLVVDSSVSHVTDHTALPNHVSLPKISDVIACCPLGAAVEQMTGYTMDVSKAHRRIKIKPSDRGLLCFWHGTRLFQCLTLNFGARASGWWWNRVAALMVRTFHKMLRYRHALWQYVDDLLVFLDKQSAPLWASLLVILCAVLNIPMSWHKCQLSEELTWIGWRINVASWCVSLPRDKLEIIRRDVVACLSTSSIPAKLLEKLIGRLLWLTSLWHFCRPLLGPLYHTLHHIQPTLFGFSWVQWHTFLAKLDEQLVLTSHFSHPQISAGSKVSRVANFQVSTLTELQQLPLKSRRVYALISDPAASTRPCTPQTKEALESWLDILQSTPMVCSMLPASRMEVYAAADAMATATTAGFGGHATLHNGRQIWFQFTITLEEAQAFFPFPIADMQHGICAWELLAQFALSWMVWSALPLHAHFRIFPQLCDNSGSEAVSHKGLSTKIGLQWMVGRYFVWQRRNFFIADISHIAGELNVMADGLSRGKPCQELGLEIADSFDIPWRSLCSFAKLHLKTSSGKWPASFVV